MHRQRRARLPRAGYSRRAAAWTSFLTFRQGISFISFALKYATSGKRLDITLLRR
jgi:SAM-dependent methyltransferase